MSLEEALSKNTAAVEANTTMLKALLEIKGSDTSVHAQEKHGVHGGDGSTSPAAEKKTAEPAVSKADTGEKALTYKEVSEAFLALIKKLGAASKAKAAVLDPLGLVDLKSNQEKPDLFPAIMEKINKAMSDTTGGSESLV